MKKTIFKSVEISDKTYTVGLTKLKLKAFQKKSHPDCIVNYDIKVLVYIVVRKRFSDYHGSTLPSLRCLSYNNYNPSLNPLFWHDRGLRVKK